MTTHPAACYFALAGSLGAGGIDEAEILGVQSQQQTSRRSLVTIAQRFTYLHKSPLINA